MQLSWADIKESTRKLCFLESSEYADYDEAMVEAADFALLALAREFPLTEMCDIEHDALNDGGYDTYDMRLLTLNELGEPVFMGFADDYPVICDEGGGRMVPADFTLLADRYLIIPKSFAGNLKVIYKKYPARIALLTPDTHCIEFPAEVAALMPLIMAWRIFKDDDERKSAMYYNEYISAKNGIRAKRTLCRPAGIDISAGVTV